MIRASCHSADDAMSVDFDATPWFVKAAPASIAQLARHGWVSSGIADSLDKLPGYEGLHALVVYARRLQAESLEDPSWDTYRCEVDAADATQWLRDNRPDVVVG